MRGAANFPILQAVLQEGLSGPLPKYALSALKPPQRSSNSSTDSDSDLPIIGGAFKDGSYSWLARGSVLVVMSSKTDSVISVYNFNQTFKEMRYTVTTCCICENVMIVGLKGQDGRGCVIVYNPRISKLVKAIDIPYPVTALETVASHGGAVYSTRCLCKNLRWMFGVVAVGTEEGHLYLVDLRFDGSSEVGSIPSQIEIVPPSLRNVPKTRENVTAKNAFLSFELQAPCHEDGVFHYALPDDEIVESFYPADAAVTTLLYEPRAALLFVGFNFGQFQIFSLQDMSLVHSSEFESGTSPVIQFSFQEPENDPRKFCYLWVAKGQKSVANPSERISERLTLLMYQLVFTKKEILTNCSPSENHPKGSAAARILYKNLELCSLRFEHFLDHGSTLHMCSIEKYATGIEHLEISNDEDAEYSLSPSTSFCVVAWQSLNSAKRRTKPELNVIVFDINRWYMAQMPHRFRDDEDDFIYAAFWSFDDNKSILTEDELILGMHVPSDKIHHFVSGMKPLPERYFLPSACSFSLHYITNQSRNHYSLFGYQQQVLNMAAELKSMCLVNPREIHNNMLESELYTRHAPNQAFTPDMMRENILTTALEHGQVSFLITVVRDLASGQLAACGCTLRFVMDWAWKSVANVKNSIDELCVPIFDCTCPTLDTLIKSQLRFNTTQINHLKIIFQKLMEYTVEASDQSKEELKTKLNVVTLIHQYLKSVQWFISKGLLPEQLDDVENDQEIMTPDGILIYKYTRLRQVFDLRRSELSRLHVPDLLLIDGWVEEIGQPLMSRWLKEEGGKITYPPPSFMTLLDMYYLDCVDVVTKHCLIMYLLYDVLAMFSTLDDEGKDANSDLHETERERLNCIASFLDCFLVPTGLVKLTQGFWLLDHKNFQDALNVFLDPAASRPSCSWQERRILRAFLYQGHPAMALKYISTCHPRVETIDDAKMHITIYIRSREPLKAWNLVQMSAGQHDMNDLFSHLFTLSQQYSQLDQLLKIPFSDSEEEMVIKYLRESNSLEATQILVLFYLQHSKYVEAIRLHSQSKHIRLMNDQSEESRRKNAKLDHIVQAYSNLLPRIEREVAFSTRGFLKQPALARREAHKPSTLSTIVHPVKNVEPTSHAGRLVSLMDKMEQKKKGTQEPVLTPLRRRPFGAVVEPKTAVENAFVYPTIDLSKRRSSIDIHGIRGRRSSFGSPAQYSGNQTSRGAGSQSTVSQLDPSSVKERRLSSLSLVSMLLQTPPISRRRQSVSRQDVAQNIQTPQSILKVKKLFKRDKSRSPSLSVISQTSHDLVVKPGNDDDNISVESGTINSESSGQFRREIPTISTPSLKLFKQRGLKKFRMESEAVDNKEEQKIVFDTPKKLRFAGLDASANDSGLSAILSPPVEQVAGLPNLTPVQVEAENSQDDGEMEVDITGDESDQQQIEESSERDDEEPEKEEQSDLSDVEEEEEIEDGPEEELFIAQVPEIPMTGQPSDNDEVICLDSSSDEDSNKEEEVAEEEEDIIVEQEVSRPAEVSLRLVLTSSDESFTPDVQEEGYGSEEFTLEHESIFSEPIPEISTPRGYRTTQKVKIGTDFRLNENKFSSQSPSHLMEEKIESIATSEVLISENLPGEDVVAPKLEDPQEFVEEAKTEDVLLVAKSSGQLEKESDISQVEAKSTEKDSKYDDVFESQPSDEDEKSSPELYVPHFVEQQEEIEILISDDESDVEDSKPREQEEGFEDSELVKEDEVTDSKSRKPDEVEDSKPKKQEEVVSEHPDQDDIRESSNAQNQEEEEVLQLRLSASEEEFSDEILSMEEKEESKDEEVVESPPNDEVASNPYEATSDYQSMSATKMEEDVASPELEENLRLLEVEIESADVQIPHQDETKVELHQANLGELPVAMEAVQPAQTAKDITESPKSSVTKVEIIINPSTPVIDRMKTDPTYILSPPTTRRSKRKSSKATQYTPKPAQPVPVPPAQSKDSKIPKSPSRVSRRISKQTQVTPAPEPTFLFSPPKARKRSSRKADQSIVKTNQPTVTLSPTRSTVRRTRVKTKSSDQDSDKSPVPTSPVTRSQRKSEPESTKKLESSPERLPLPTTPSRRTRQSPGRKPPSTPTRSSSRIRAKISVTMESDTVAESETLIAEEPGSVAKRTRRRTSATSDVASSGTESEAPSTPSRRSSRRSSSKSKVSPQKETAKVPELTPLPEEEEEEAVIKKRKKEKVKDPEVKTARTTRSSSTTSSTRTRRKAKVSTMEE